MSFSLPTYTADWLPFAAATLTLLLGLFALFAPHAAVRLLRLDTAPAHPEAVAEIRGLLAGFLIGPGLATLLFYDQPFVQMVLGAAWAFAAFGRLVSILVDAGFTLANLILLLFSLALAAMCLAPVFGLVAPG